MKRVLIGLNVFVAISVIFLLFQFFNKDKKLVYININKLVAEYKGLADLQKAMEQKSKIWKANVDTLGQELENNIKKYERERPKNSEKENKLHEEILRNK